MKMKLDNGTEVIEGNLYGVEGQTGVWTVERITLRAQIYLRNVETNSTLILRASAVLLPHTHEQNSGF